MADLRRIRRYMRALKEGRSKLVNLIEIYEKDVLGRIQRRHVNPERFEKLKGQIVPFKESQVPTPSLRGAKKAAEAGVWVPGPGEGWPEGKAVAERYQHYEHYVPAEPGETPAPPPSVRDLEAVVRGKKGERVVQLPGEDHTLFMPYGPGGRINIPYRRGANNSAQPSSIPSYHLPAVHPPVDSDAVGGIVSYATSTLPYVEEELAVQDAMRAKNPAKLATSSSLFALLSAYTAFTGNAQAFEGLMDTINRAGGYQAFVEDLHKNGPQSKWAELLYEHGSRSQGAAHSVKQLVSVMQDPYTYEFWRAPDKIAETYNSIPTIQPLPFDSNDQQREDWVRRFWEAHEEATRKREDLFRKLKGFSNKTGSFALHMYNRDYPIFTIDRHMVGGYDMAMGGPGYGGSPAEPAYKHIEDWYGHLYTEKMPYASPFAVQWSIWNALRGGRHEPHQFVFESADQLKL